MSLRSLFQSLKPRSRVRPATFGQRDATRRRSSTRLQLEPLEDRSLPSNYLQTNLAADQPGTALIHDPELIDAWGISINPTGTFWVSARATGVSTVYSGDVTPTNGAFIPFVKSALTVTIPGGSPTGQVFNPPTTPPDFVVSAGGASARAVFIFASETGHITGWNPGVPPPPPAPPSRNAFITATTPGAVYTGLAIGNNGTGNFLYASDFKNDKIDDFDRTYTPTILGSFDDPGIPDDYGPFNIWNIAGKLYVAYAREVDGDALPDGGTGYISVFDTNGNFLQRLVSETQLNQPWGMALAPGNFGEFSNALIVGNFGTGLINAYDATSGAFLGGLRDGSGNFVHIDGLLGLHFGNGVSSGDSNALYFAAGPEGGTHGLFGSLRVAPARVDSMMVNDGNAQRSMVNSLTVTFSDIVTLDPAAFELRKQGGSLVNLTVDISTVGARTVAVLSFAGPGIIGGSLADGNYVLTIRSDMVDDAFGRALDGDGDSSAGGDRIDALFRLFGDSDGDRDVDLHDLFQFLSTLGRREGDPGFLWYMDYNGDDRVGVADLLAFVHRIGDRLDP